MFIEREILLKNYYIAIQLQQFRKTVTPAFFVTICIPVLFQQERSKIAPR